MLTSPLSYNAIMNMTAAGSSGDTLDQILHHLQHETIQDVNLESSEFAKLTTTNQTTNKRKRKGKIGSNGAAPIISFLNGAWVNQNYRLKDSFHHLIQSVYKAKVESIDCGEPELVVKEINKWASASTKGLIAEVLKKDHITPNTTLILTNALYFKGSWESEFKKTFTSSKTFHLIDGKEIKVPFMGGCEEYSDTSFEDFQVARIPYKSGGDHGRKFSMYIFLPMENDGLESLLRKVDSNPDFFDQYCDFPLYCKSDKFRIPKFKFTYSTEEGPEIMKSMGLTLPFDMEKAELNELADHEDFKKYQRPYVSGIIQKAFIEVNEEGTVAAAVTARNAAGGCAFGRRRKLTKFIADHPFMFVVQEEKSEVLFFVGVVLNSLEA